MATITYPTSGDHWLPKRFAPELRTNVLVSPSPLSGSVDTLELPGARWVFGLDYDPAYFEEQAEREALWTEMGAQANRMALYHFARPVPRGTMRGSPTLSATAAAGATSLSISTTSGNTLLKGDMLGVGGQLVQVVADATAAAGVLTVSIRPALRAQVASGQPVTWDKPTSLFIPSGPVAIPYNGSMGEGFSVEMVEAWA